MRKELEQSILIKIYALRDPKTEHPFYVGRTSKRLNTRLYGHIRRSKSSDSEVSLRIRSIIYKGKQPKISLLEEKMCNSLAEVEELEQYWIDKISLEYPLCNKNSAKAGMIARDIERPYDEYISSRQLEFIKSLGILDLVGREFSANSPEIQAIVRRSISRRRGLQSIFGVTMGTLEPIPWVRILLAKVGLKLEFSSRRHGQVRFYRIKE